MTHKRKIVAIVEARMTSSRLPGKHLLEVMGRPIIAHLINRLKAINSIDEIVVAMTTRVEDDPLESYIKSLEVSVYRGSEDDVMGRVLEAAKKFDADVICEVTGDCTIIDTNLIDHAIKTFMLNASLDYLSNGRSGLPDGMGCQVFTVDSLAKSAAMTSEPLDREHVTLHIKRNPTLFSVFFLGTLSTYYWPNLAVTLDEHDDYIFLKRIIEYFGDQNPLFTCLELFEFLRKNTQLLNINRAVERRGDT